MPHLEHISDEDLLQKVVKYHPLLSNLPTDYKIEDILLLQDRDLHPLSTSADLETALKENEALIKILNMTPLEKIKSVQRTSDHGIVPKDYLNTAPEVPSNLERFIEGLSLPAMHEATTPYPNRFKYQHNPWKSENPGSENGRFPEDFGSSINYRPNTPTFEGGGNVSSSQASA